MALQLQDLCQGDAISLPEEFFCERKIKKKIDQL